MESVFLEHGLLGKERANHKYKAREWVNGKWQYIYDEAARVKEASVAKVQNAVNSIRTKVDDVSSAVDKVNAHSDAKIAAATGAVKRAYDTPTKKSIESRNPKMKNMGKQAAAMTAAANRAISSGKGSGSETKKKELAKKANDSWRDWSNEATKIVEDRKKKADANLKKTKKENNAVARAKKVLKELNSKK